MVALLRTHLGEKKKYLKQFMFNDFFSFSCRGSFDKLFMDNLLTFDEALPLVIIYEPPRECIEAANCEQQKRR